MDNYKILRKIGSGNFAKVYLAVHIETGQQVALKLVDKSEGRNNNIKNIRRINREMANMKLLQGHQNIVTVFETFETSKHFGIAMEYVSGGELFDFVQKEEGMNETSAREMFTKIIHGVQHCHDNGITHRDLKLENILLDEDLQPKIADFGFSKNIPSSPLTSSSVGSPLYSSPEIIQGKPYQGPECDVWSLGVILYVMLTASMPFDDNNIGQFLVKIENGDYPEPCGTSDAVRHLISKMLDPNPTTRFTLNEILSHPWVKGLCKRTSPLTFCKKRRQGICCENIDYIHRMLQEMNECSCSCHTSDSTDFLVLCKHCEDCEDVQSNNPEAMLKRSIHLSRNSSLSSGYGGSEMGSQYLIAPSPRNSRINILGLEHSHFGGRRASVPRKSSTGTISSNTTITSKNSHHRCSVPVKTPRILNEGFLEEEEEDIVFV